MDTLIIFSAKYLIVLIALGGALAVACAGTRRTSLMFLLAAALPLSYALARLAGLLYGHQQPFFVEGFEPLIPHAIDNTFPSDHTLLAGVFASVAFLYDKRAGLVLWALALLVGAARAAAGLHYPVDIAASVLLAVLSVYIAHRILKFLLPRY